MMKKCKCGIAAMIAFSASLLVGYVNGYTLGNWAGSSWIAAFFIAGAAGICLSCRQKEDESEDEHTVI